MASKKNKQANKGKEKAKKKPLVIRYDEEGNKIGDDGYVMTPTRTRMHRMFNAYFIWAIIAAVCGLLCTIFAYTQGQEYADWNLIAVGGNQYMGFSVATMLRIEAFMCLFTALAGLLGHFWGFRWFYDRKSELRVKILLGAVAGVSAAYLLVALTQVGLPEPISIINIVFVFLTSMFMSQVKVERSTLAKAKVAGTIVKE